MGRVLGQLDELPDRVITSSAARARRTAELVVGDLADVSVEVAAQLYMPSVDDVIETLVGVPASCERVLVVGHQPTWGQAVAAFTGARVAFVTAAIAAVDVRSFRDPFGGELQWFLPPRRAERLLS